MRHQRQTEEPAHPREVRAAQEHPIDRPAQEDHLGYGRSRAEDAEDDHENKKVPGGPYPSEELPVQSTQLVVHKEWETKKATNLILSFVHVTDRYNVFGPGFERMRCREEGTIVTQAYSPRDYLEKEIADRASHDSAEDVRTTCSFARAERLLGREYHGRFLIELLQNAADASRSADTASGRSRVVVQITEGPALLVANQGAPMSAEVVIQSLGHIGASTKAEGEAIGHKGIGFKSVLELTLTPEIYSGLQQPSPALAVGFDPEKARERICGDSTGWDGIVAEVQGLDPEDDLAAVPVLRFPYWIEELPTEVADLKERGSTRSCAFRLTSASPSGSVSMPTPGWRPFASPLAM